MHVCGGLVNMEMEKARAFRDSYSEPVRNAMAWYAGQLPENAVRLPEIPYLCYR